ncbi:DUF4367 domain-containing protein [Pseudoflavonifractor sp. 524-17]|uniref:DUF4367 domain-containing protein n=1 Tax=Pseudoflavonifractor sp. 524-17 TaxID=2304577 RepID=UPI00137B35D6|nr:DUF4367 domain-containing protein [Pseudoflavonifractor sp. 524-17]NCE66288.1 DUF4367 domain-containing protein [Pseudoflavonifractor sp. 524-17]
MSEPRDCSGQKQVERKEASWYSEKSAEDLLEEMEVVMDEMTDVDYDSQKIDDYLTALNEKAPLNTEFDPKKAWSAFRSQHAILFEDETTTPHTAHNCSTAKPRRGRRLLPRLVALAAAIAILGMFAAQAAGIDILGIFGRWTNETFHFERVGSEKSGVPTPSIIPEDGLSYATLQEALDAYGIQEQLAPTWIPEGYEPVYIDAIDSGTISFESCFTDGENDLGIIFWCAHEPIQDFGVTEKDSTPVVLYEKNGITHYIMSNMDVMVVKWVNNNCECTIVGPFTVDELEHMIDSIYT